MKKNLLKHIKLLTNTNYLFGSALLINSHQYFFGAESKADRKYSDESLFELGSITKFFISLIIFKLISEKLISLETELGFLFPEINNPEVSKILIKQLLNHTSGLERIPSNLDLNQLNSYDYYNDSELFVYLNSVKLNENIYQYSNTGFALLGLIIEKLYKIDLEDVLKQAIFLPLKMNNTSYYLSAPGCLLDGALIDSWSPQSFKGAVGLKSTTKDMNVFLNGLSSGFQNDINKIANDYFEFLIFEKLNQCNDRFVFDGATFGHSTVLYISKDFKDALFFVTNSSSSLNFIDDFVHGNLTEVIPDKTSNEASALVGKYKRTDSDLYREVYLKNGFLFSNLDKKLPQRLVPTSKPNVFNEESTGEIFKFTSSNEFIISGIHDIYYKKIS